MALDAMNRAYASEEVRAIIEGKVEVPKTLLELTSLTAEQLDHERFRSF